jgi:hypothetical protein
MTVRLVINEDQRFVVVTIDDAQRQISRAIRRKLIHVLTQVVCKRIVAELEDIKQRCGDWRPPGGRVSSDHIAVAALKS